MQRLTNGIKGRSIRENRPLTRGELELYVPSIFSYDAHESRSSRFAPVPTIEVVDALALEGYHPFFAVQTAVRDAGKREHTKHMLRFRKDITAQDGTVNEVILCNANDGTSAYQLHAGKFRFVCQNGLVMGDVKHSTKVYHKGQNIMDDVIEGVYHVVDEFDEIERYENEMKLIQLSDTEREAMAISAYIMKEGMPENNDFSATKYRPELLLKSHNPEDHGNKTLFSTFNVLQENLITKGNQTGINASGRRTRSKPVTQIDKNLKLNKDLWAFAQHIVATKNS